MRRHTIIVLAGFLIWTAAVAAISWNVFEAMASSGTINVRVDTPEGRFRARVPASIATAAVGMTRFDIGGIGYEVNNGLQGWRPALRAAIEELDRYENVPLLEINEGRDRIRVMKIRGRMMIVIEEGREQIRISVPIGTLRRALDS
ncbi:MAG TPA: hypothetical protein VM557_06665 [Thermoanaerobaculia bacterium]|nr:hypothetical protein [Thermoanaerobaculia bacterium]